MTSLYDILKANRLGMDSDPWIAILGEAWRASEEEFKEYTGLVPYTFIANGQPLIDWYIKGNMSQTGTPTPQNPIQPQETGEKTENLFDKDGTYSVGVTTNNFTISGLDPNKYYTCSTNFERISGVATASLYFGGGNSTSNGVWSDTPKTFKPNSSGEIIVYIRYKESEGAPSIIDDVMAGTIWIMVNEGSTPLPHEPYGYKLDIKSANTTTPVYLGEVQTTRKIKKLVITGNEGWKTASSDNTKHYLDVISPDYLRANNQITYISSHYSTYGQTTSATSVPIGSMAMSSATAQRLYIADANYTTNESFIQYLQEQYANGTPVTVWYVLATPETAVVNEPIRKIGDYVDTLTATQAGVEIPTNNGSTTLDIDTTLKPSEVYIKYKGR